MAAKTQALEIGRAVRELPPGSNYQTLTKVKPSGSLQARRQADGAVAFVWRFSIGPSGAQRTERVPIGFYDATLPPKSLSPKGNRYSFEAAIRAAEALAQAHHAHRRDGGLPMLRAAENEAKRAASEAKREAAHHTLRNLLTDYCDHLKTIERRSHLDARSIFKLHIFEAWPALANKPANQVSPEEVADMMRRANDAGKARTANKLRSYMRAAYETAKSARVDAAVPLKFKAYAVTTNPAADAKVIRAGNRSAKKPLSADEMRAYWCAIRDMPGLRGAALRLHLLTGAQRLAQLVRLAPADIKDDVIMLYDSKGRPGEPPRQHPVPLLPLAVKALKECATMEGKYALSTGGRKAGKQGSTHISSTTLSGWAQDAAAGIPGFEAKRLRSGVETLLASAGVSDEIRGRLQSHGIRGVQDRHYNAYEYLPEKRAALETLLQLLKQRRGGARASSMAR